jgi:uncharacterized protein
MANFYGKFVWYELMTTDMKAAEAFYGSVVGWGAKDAGLPNHAYTLFTIGEMPTAGMMTLPPEAAAGARPGWIGYVAVDDVDTRAKEIAESGGAICHAPTDIPGIGRFAVVSDPQNVVFALFKPGEGSPGEPPLPWTPGRTGWHELHAADGPSAFAYYSKLFGWTKGDALDMGPMGVYQIFNHDGVMAGGIFTKPAAEPVPYWLFYFNVDEINAAVERVKAGGGQILNGPMEVPGGSMIVQGLDPQGAMFALVEPRGGPERH